MKNLRNNSGRQLGLPIHTLHENKSAEAKSGQVADFSPALLLCRHALNVCYSEPSLLWSFWLAKLLSTPLLFSPLGRCCSSLTVRSIGMSANCHKDIPAEQTLSRENAIPDSKYTVCSKSPLSGMWSTSFWQNAYHSCKAQTASKSVVLCPYPLFNLRPATASPHKQHQEHRPPEMPGL